MMEPTIEQLTDWLRQAQDGRTYSDGVDHYSLDAAVLWWRYCADREYSFKEIRDRVPGVRSNPGYKVDRMLRKLMWLQVDRGVPILDSLPQHSRLARALKRMVGEVMEGRAHVERLRATFPELSEWAISWISDSRITMREQIAALTDDELKRILRLTSGSDHVKMMFQEIRAAVPYRSDPCPYCGGTGRRRSEEVS